MTRKGSAKHQRAGWREVTARRALPVARRGLGVALVLMIVVPIYRTLADVSGIGAQQTVRLADRYTMFLWTGLGGTLAIALLAAALVRAAWIEEKLDGLRQRLLDVDRRWFLGTMAMLSGGLTVLFTLLVLDGKPIMVDAVSQLIHGRYIAAGRLAGPVLPLAEFWQFQFMLDTPNGWVSQYPFGHALLLAVGFKLGAVWLTPAVLVTMTVLLTGLIAERLFPEDRTTARLAVLLLALSPFFLALAGAYMNHVTAAAFAVLAVYCALRARDGRALWALAAGAAVGMVLVTRPLAGLVIGAVVFFGIWLAAWRAGSLPGVEVGARAALAVAGGLPLAGALAAYNALFFGSPLRFGYLAAWGPRHGLGFHADPWGVDYGAPAALAYSSAELLGLSSELLWSTVPVVGVVGFYLLFERRLTGGARLAVAWALLPVLANAFYWHHDLVMGPRMLNEAAPAWALLAAVAAVGLVRLAPHSDAPGNFSPRAGVLVMLLLGLAAGILYYGPRRLLSFGRAQTFAGTSLDAPRTAFPSVIFVHDSWRTRLGARLDAAGMRMDSVQAALSHNPPCTVQRFLDEGEPEGAPRVTAMLRFEAAGGPRAAAHTGKEALEGGPSPECERQTGADRRGITTLPGLLWQGDLPGLEPQGAMFVRDMGPERNARLLDRLPERRPLVLMPAAPYAATNGEEPVAYEPAMRRLWGEQSRRDQDSRQ